MKKALSVILLAALLCNVAACGGTASGSSDTTSAEVETTTAVETEGHYLDKLPDMDFEGRTITFGNSIDNVTDIVAEEMTGDVTSDAIYERNTKIEEKFNIKIESLMPSTGMYDWYQNLAKTVLAGDQVYDIAGHYAYDIDKALGQGIYQDWSTVKYIDMDAPWWSQSINEGFTFNGKLLGISGYLGMSMMQYAQAMFFNTRIVEEYGYTAGDLYKLVYDGKWTFETFDGIVKGIYSDLNGNNQVDDNDLFGITNCSGTSCDLWQASFDIPITTRDKDGNFTELIMSDKRVSALEVLNTFFTTNPGARIIAQDTSKSTWLWYEQYNFSIGQQAFTNGVFLAAYNLYRDMSDVYSIVPTPKWDEAQEQYLSNLNDRYTVWGIPKTVTDTDFVGLIAEAMACESYESVYPAFYDVALKQKFSTDEDCANMVDLVMEGLRFDIAYMFGEYISEGPYIFRNLLKAGSSDLASTYASKKTAIEEGIVKVMSFFED